MKAIELLQKYPESSKLICSYYLEIMLESLKDDNLPEDFKDHVREQGIDNDNISAIIDGNPRNLFDFFDLIHQEKHTRLQCVKAIKKPEI
jgi:predicted metal-dependent phosphotriesterase family hydrolase